MDSNEPKMPPHSPEAEMSTLGAMLQGRDAAARALEILKPEDFYRDPHRQTFQAMGHLFDRGEPIDLVSVSNELKSHGLLEATGGMGYLHRLTEQTPYAANVEHYAGIVANQARARRLLLVALQAVEQCYAGEEDADTLLEKTENALLALRRGEDRAETVLLRPLLKEAFEEAERRFYAKTTLTGLSTGFPDLDRATTGLQTGDLIIIAGRPSMGKTSLALNISQSVALQKNPVLLFSLEMSKEVLAQSFLCAEGKIPLQRFRTGRFLQSDWDRMAKASERLYEVPLYLDDIPGLSAIELRAKARRIHQRQPLGLVVVDYLQLMRGVQRYDSRVQEISEITRSLKGLARELRVPLVACCQLSRAVEQRANKRPMLSDLRESGTIEADADLVLGLYRASYYQQKEELGEDDLLGPEGALNETEVLILKQRNGPTGMVKLGFRKAFKMFVSLERPFPAAGAPSPRGAAPGPGTAGEREIYDVP